MVAADCADARLGLVLRAAWDRSRFAAHQTCATIAADSWHLVWKNIHLPILLHAHHGVFHRRHHALMGHTNCIASVLGRRNRVDCVVFHRVPEIFATIQNQESSS